MKLYSVKILKALVYSRDRLEDFSYNFEEVIVMALLENDFFQTSYENILRYFKEELNSGEYVNGNGDLVYNSVVKVLSYFEIQDMDLVRNLDLQGEPKILGELYSRYLIFDEKTRLDHVMDKYYSDYREYPL